MYNRSDCKTSEFAQSQCYKLGLLALLGCLRNHNSKTKNHARLSVIFLLLGFCFFVCVMDIKRALSACFDEIKLVFDCF